MSGKERIAVLAGKGGKVVDLASSIARAPEGVSGSSASTTLTQPGVQQYAVGN